MKKHHQATILLLAFYLLSCETPFAPEPLKIENEFNVTHDFDGGPKLLERVPITISWSQIVLNNFEKYVIQRSIQEGEEEVWTLRTEITDPLVTAYTDSLHDDLTFRYRVTIVTSDGGHIESLTEQIRIRTTSITVPGECQSLQRVYDSPYIDDGDTILVNPPEPCTFTRTLYFFGKDILIQSVEGKENTIFRRGGTIVWMDRGTLTGFTFEKGGVRLSGTAQMKDCIVTEVHTSAYFGEKSAVVMSDSAEISNCTISNNSKYKVGNTGDGGGMIVRGNAAVRNSVIAGNRAGRRGGGIFVDGDPRFVNCIITNNVADEGGGAMFLTLGSAPKVVNCVVHGNESGLPGRKGGAFHSDKYPTLTLLNSIVWKNPSQGGNARLWQNASYSDIGGYDRGEGNLNSPPLFVDPESGDFHLSPESPCINAGDPSPEYNDTDGSRNDMGAYGGPYGDWQ